MPTKFSWLNQNIRIVKVASMEILWVDVVEPGTAMVRLVNKKHKIQLTIHVQTLPERSEIQFNTILKLPSTLLSSAVFRRFVSKFSGISLLACSWGPDSCATTIRYRIISQLPLTLEDLARELEYYCAFLDACFDWLHRAELRDASSGEVQTRVQKDDFVRMMQRLYGAIAPFDVWH